MATFTVDTLSDDPTDGDTLREALALADGAAGADTIEFEAGLTGTITLAGSELTIASDVTIDGDARITIDAVGLSRVLQVAQGSDTDPNEVDLAGLTITGGKTTADGVAAGGGGIRANQDTSLTLSDSTVRGNGTEGRFSYGGGILAIGDLTLTGSTVSGNSTEGEFANGGGIFAFGNVTLTDSTVSGNGTAGYNAIGGGIVGRGAVMLRDSTVSGNSTTGYYGTAGGIFAFGNVTLTDSTVSGNGTEGDRAYGGGIFADGEASLTRSTVDGNRTEGAYGYGGGIYARGDLTLTESTVSGNSTAGAEAGGGGIYAGSDLTVTGSTVSGNSTTGYNARGGGIDVGGNLNLANSIVAGNQATLDSGSDISGTITTSNGHNIFGSDVDGNATGDIENVSTALLFAGGLADNGGPTRTIALKDDPTNPALAGANPADSSATDQRGVARPQPAGSGPDIGAFELDQSPPVMEIVGTSGKDFLKGTTGDDVIRGRAGDDTLLGLPGDDQLFGDRGRDILFGKAGIDQLTGGLGADRFVFRAAEEAAPDGPAYEEILDFSRSQGDRMDLRTIDANDAVGGNQPFRFIGDDPLTGPAQLSVTDFAGDFLVSGSTDAEADDEFAFVVRTDLASLRASDFLL